MLKLYFIFTFLLVGLIGCKTANQSAISDVDYFRGNKLISLSGKSRAIFAYHPIEGQEFTREAQSFAGTDAENKEIRIGGRNIFIQKSPPMCYLSIHTNEARFKNLETGAKDFLLGLDVASVQNTKKTQIYSTPKAVPFEKILTSLWKATKKEEEIKGINRGRIRALHDTISSHFATIDSKLADKGSKAISYGTLAACTLVVAGEKISLERNSAASIEEEKKSTTRIAATTFFCGLYSWIVGAMGDYARMELETNKKNSDKMNSNYERGSRENKELKFSYRDLETFEKLLAHHSEESRTPKCAAPGTEEFQVAVEKTYD